MDLLVCENNARCPLAMWVMVNSPLKTLSPMLTYHQKEHSIPNISIEKSMYNKKAMSEEKGHLSGLLLLLLNVRKKSLM